MKESPAFTCLFLDIGGVLLTDGWPRRSRRRAAAQFDLDLADMEERHHLTFETYEEGRLSLDEYLDLVVFFRKRSFSRARFRRFMFAESKPYPEMIDLIAHLKVRYGLKVGVVSNEGRELNAYRIRAFKLGELWISSSPPASSTSESRTRRSFGSRWTSPRSRPRRPSISRTPRCSSRSRKPRASAAFFTRTSGPPAHSSPRSASGTTKGSTMADSAGSPTLAQDLPPSDRGRHAVNYRAAARSTVQVTPSMVPLRVRPASGS